MLQGLTITISIVILILLSEVAIANKWKDQDFDYIVVGAGAAGAAVAARLSENGRFDVLLLEAGGEPRFSCRIPYFALGPFKGDFDWNFLSESQQSACLAFIDNKWKVPRGKGLGGSTIINGMVFTRGNKKDFDLWKELGNEGWGYEDVLPYFIKMEDYQANPKPEDETYHGKGGPIAVNVPPYKTEIADAFLDAGKELGYSHVDYNAGKQTGFFNPVFTIKNGSRWTTYDAYLKPNGNRQNLHIVTHAFVTKIKFDKSNKAVGVYFEKDDATWFASVRKEVIVSAGANNSPHILMLSGIGPKEDLEKFKIPVLVNSPGVGQNMQDHVAVSGLSFSLDVPVGLNPIKDISSGTIDLWESKGEGPLTVPIKSEGIAFMNSQYADPSEDWPDYELVIAQLPSIEFDLKPGYSKPFELSEGNSTLSIILVLLRPKSIGYMTLRSGDPHIPPKFHLNYLTEYEDVKILVDAVKSTFKLMETKAFKQYGARYHGYIIPGCKEHEHFSDEYFECFIRHYTFGVFHQSGTCKMGPDSDSMSVVDARLRVKGVKGLRVADVSICPTVVTAHTMAAAIMIGEKAADLILEDQNNV